MTCFVVYTVQGKLPRVCVHFEQLLSVLLSVAVLHKQAVNFPSARVCLTYT